VTKLYQLRLTEFGDNATHARQIYTNPASDFVLAILSDSDIIASLSGYPDLACKVRLELMQI
jgi:hypothetical protein